MKGPAFLFTSAGRRVELLRLFKHAYESLGLESNIVALDINPLAPALQVADHPYVVPRLDDPSYPSVLTSVCQEHAVQRIFPLIDPDIPMLNLHRDMLERTGACVATVPPHAGDIVADKWRTSQFFQGIGLPVPQSWLPEDVEPDRTTYPLFVKPRRGSAGKDATRVDDAGELRFCLQRVEDPIVQEFLPGPEITSDVVCDVDGSVLAVVARQRLETRGGEVSKGVTVHDTAIVDACAEAARALRAVGPITVQCLMREGHPFFTEVNARLGGGFPLGVAAGADSLKWLVARAAGISCDLPPLGSYRAGLYVTRFDDAYYCTEADLEQISRRHL